MTRSSEESLLFFYDVRREIANGAVSYDALKGYLEIRKDECHKRACNFLSDDPKRSEVELAKSAVYLHLIDGLVDDLNQRIENLEHKLKSKRKEK